MLVVVINPYPSSPGADDTLHLDLAGATAVSASLILGIAPCSRAGIVDAAEAIQRAVPTDP